MPARRVGSARQRTCSVRAVLGSLLLDEGGPGLCHLRPCISRPSHKASDRAQSCLMNEWMARPLPSQGGLPRKHKPGAACALARRRQQRVKSHSASPQAPEAHSPFDPRFICPGCFQERKTGSIPDSPACSAFLFLFFNDGGGKGNGPLGHIMPGNQPPSCHMLGLPKGQINRFLLRAGERRGPEVARLTGWAPQWTAAQLLGCRRLQGWSLCMHSRSLARSLTADSLLALGLDPGL